MTDPVGAERPDQAVAPTHETVDTERVTELRTLRAHVDALAAAGDLAGATSSGAELLGALKDALGPHHPDTLNMAVMLAQWTFGNGYIDIACEQLQRLIPLLQEALGPTHPDTLMARHTLACHPDASVDPAATLITWVQLFADEHSSLGPDHAYTLSARYNVAIARRRLGDLAGAIDEASQILTTRQRVQGSLHPEVLVARIGLAVWRGDLGHTADAVNEAATVLPLLRSTFGADHEHTLAARFVCAKWNPADHRDVDALADCEVLVEDQTRTLGAEHPMTVAGREMLLQRQVGWQHWLDEYHGLARAIYDDEGGTDSGQWAEDQAAQRRREATSLLDHIIAIKRRISEHTRTFGTESHQVLTSRYHLAHALWAAKEFTAAREHTQRLVTDCVRFLGDDHPLTALARAALSAGDGLDRHV
ncbi:hypothetical protein B7435_30040 [Mycolicibacterium peregrinum]|uniref:Tetratricopeptide repeat protein n=1 Tax=Mycolicibacterium alvei TaxID=67081 RepID=A0A6N4V1P2_9MYCO|nr:MULTISPECIES: tetratricopeptide repeat protein [Mycolicibacterium]MCV7003544.1 tetratricopeptide repeat protein [Mycolicibacterium alvei]OWL95530.1 hypothetical protein B7435_30040 [Mycolicibacterium peregrinum]BBX30498.1 hypothetical protein MALV_56230 [Mycolicibacterium alvei]